MGQVQPIGGVNYKIEGFYAVCRAKGLTGVQGVIIPKLNERNLMLNDDVVEAVRAGRFHIWSVSHVDEGMELLTGVPAGKVREDGSFPKGSVNFLVHERLMALSEQMRKLAEEGKGEK
jgi:predicted ATP-dependent protease